MDQVTAIMVTGKTLSRQRMAYAAVQSFLQQTWPEKDLLIINDGGQLFHGALAEGQDFVWSPSDGDQRPPRPANVLEVLVHPGRTLGELRNMGLEMARGTYVVQWDDDDWSHPYRIAAQMWLAGEGAAVLLRYQLRYSFLHNRARRWKWTYKPNPGIPGTVLHWNDPRYRYRAERRQEDDHFLQDHFRHQTRVLDNAANAELYLRFFHGDNTWDEMHVMGGGYEQQNVWDLNDVEASYLEHVLLSHYLPAGSKLAYTQQA